MEHLAQGLAVGLAIGLLLLPICLCVRLSSNAALAETGETSAQGAATSQYSEPPKAISKATLEEAPLDSLLALPPDQLFADHGQHGIAMHGKPKYPAGFTKLEYASDVAMKGGILRQAAIGTFDTLNPFTVKGIAAADSGLQYDSLMRRVWDEPFSLYSLIAKRVVLPDHRRWIAFELDSRARFQDGQPITLADVLFSFETLRDKGRPSFGKSYRRVQSAKPWGINGVLFELAAADAPPESIDRELPLILAMMPILPKHIWEGRDFAATTLDVPVIGSGAYRAIAAEAGRQVTFESIKDYWAADLPVNVGHYNFDTLVHDYYRDQTVAFEALKGGRIDFWRESNLARWQNGYADLARMQDGRLVQSQFSHQRPEPTWAIIFNTRRPNLQDLEVRKALSGLLPFAWLNQAFYAWQMRHSGSYFANSELANAGEDSSLQNTPQNMAFDPRAWAAHLRTLDADLQAAGSTVVDGKRVDQSGKPITFSILVGDKEFEKVALEFARQAARLGITITVDFRDSTTFRASLDSFDYDMVIYRWISTLSPGVEQASYWGSPAANQTGTRNYAGVKDTEVDHLIDGLMMAKDRADLVQSVRTLDKKLQDGFYSIPLFYAGVDSVAYSSAIQPPTVTPLYGLVIETWYTRPKL